ncbi:hypothetical protein DY000_02042736 [Brassica cretica]|uniref:Replication protein A OB domain-containing protein n=1 Tax=Brassica cretica TaxID=69181 RepID=A0ABQ7BIB5_BRACR|nr:hypothetical protein DY000_02042736 [Brassica cretica]
MANVSVLLSDSKTGRSSSTVQVRLLRFLVAMNATMIPATVNVNRLATHMPNLKSSSVYSLTVFDVIRCNQNYRLSDSALLIRFSDSNSFNEVKPAILIPLEFFWLRHNHSDMLCLANTNTQFLDLIGEITVVMSTVTDPSQDKNRVMATIKMDNDMYVTMSLFDSQAVKIHNQQETMRGNPRVVVATSVNPKMVGRTRHWAYTSISTAKVESLSIAELNNFVTTAPSQEIDFVCTGRVTGIKMEKEWCYVSCSNCDKKL